MASENVDIGARPAWSLITLGGQRQHAGNRGYSDDVRSVYRYDSLIPNYKRLSVGDLVVIRDGEQVLGSALVEEIRSYPGEKEQLRCPACNTTSMKERQEKSPRFRCRHKHQFDDPVTTFAPCIVFEAWFPETFQDPSHSLAVEELAPAMADKAAQFSIRRMVPGRLSQETMQALQLEALTDPGVAASVPTEPNVFLCHLYSAQLASSLANRVFAISGTRNELRPGDLLLLQLVQDEASKAEERGTRIRHALVFQRAEKDPDNALSSSFWPEFPPQRNATVLWCSAELPVQPFSIASPPFTKSYRSRQNAVKLDAADAALVLDKIRSAGIDPRSPNVVRDAEPVLPRDAKRREAIERYAVEWTCRTLEKRFPNLEVIERLRNNKGYDIEVLDGTRTVLFVEVKGTSSPRPVFLMSESERELSEAQSDLYELFVVWGIDPSAKTHRGVECRPGEVGADSHGIETYTWRGQLQPTIPVPDL